MIPGPLSARALRADRLATVSGSDPLAIARRRVLALHGVRLAAYVEGSRTMTPAMHRMERTLLLALAGERDEVHDLTTRAQYRAQATARRTNRIARVA